MDPFAEFRPFEQAPTVQLSNVDCDSTCHLYLRYLRAPAKIGITDHRYKHAVTIDDVVLTAPRIELPEFNFGVCLMNVGGRLQYDDEVAVELSN